MVRCDNKPAIALVLDNIVTIGNRFYELTGHYPKEQYQKGNICVRHVAGEFNPAYLLTKAIDGITFSKLVGWVKGIGGGLPAAPPPPRTSFSISCDTIT